MIKLFRLALHSAWRDARAGELRLLVVAVALGVASLTSVAFLADRIEGGLQRDARKLLGGDAVVVTDKPPPAVLFEKIKDSLKPGGLLIIQGYGKNQLKYNTGGPGKLDHLYDDALMREAFAGYEVLVCNTYETTIQEGAGHSGMSALVGFLARKP